MSLTDSGLGAGEAAVFRDQVSVVAFAGQNLQHLAHFLTFALCGPSVHSEPDIGSIAGKLPPEKEHTKFSLMSIKLIQTKFSVCFRAADLRRLLGAVTSYSSWKTDPRLIVTLLSYSIFTESWT